MPPAGARLRLPRARRAGGDQGPGPAGPRRRLRTWRPRPAAGRRDRLFTAEDGIHKKLNKKLNSQH